MSLIQFLRILAARWKLIASTILVCVVVAGAVAMTLPKRYPASARVLLDVNRSDPVTGEAVGIRDRSYAGTQVQLVKDMRVVGEVVDRLGLANAPATVAAYEKTGRTEADGGIRAWIGQRIINNLNARLVPGSSIMEISYQASTPEQAKQVVGMIRDAYVDESLRFRTETAGRTSDWYREQADKAKAALTTAETQLTDFMEKNKLVVVNGMDSDTARLAALQASLQQARGTQNTTDAAVATRLASDPVVDQLQMQLSGIEDQIALAGARLGPQHPDYKALVARRATLVNEIARARAKSQTVIAAMSGVANQSVDKLEAAVEQQQKTVLERKPVLDEFQRLSAEVDQKRKQYEDATARTDQLRLEANVDDSRIVILGDPVASSTPSYPRTNLILGMAVFFGGALAFLAAIFAEFMARRIRGYEDLAFASGVPVLATVSATRTSPLRKRLMDLLARHRNRDAGNEMQVA